MLKGLIDEQEVCQGFRKGQREKNPCSNCYNYPAIY